VGKFFTRIPINHHLPRVCRQGQAKVITFQSPVKTSHWQSATELSLFGAYISSYWIDFSLHRVVQHLMQYCPQIKLVSTKVEALVINSLQSAMTTFIENGLQPPARFENWSCFPRLNGSMTQLSTQVPWSKSARFRRAVDMVALLLQNHRFRFNMDDQVSARRKQLNRLPQGSVLLRMLFKLYTNYLSTTVSQKIHL